MPQMNRRACPACADRYPLQNGIHELPNGAATPCASGAPPVDILTMKALYANAGATLPGALLQIEMDRKREKEAAPELPKVACAGGYL
jgi:hypothetical protein